MAEAVGRGTDASARGAFRKSLKKFATYSPLSAPTGYMLEPWSLTDPEDFDGSSQSRALRQKDFEQALFDLRRGGVRPGRPPRIRTLHSRCRPMWDSGVVPIGLINLQCNVYSDSLKREVHIALARNRGIDVDSVRARAEAVETRRLFAASVLLPDPCGLLTAKERRVQQRTRFLLSDATFFGGELPQNIEVDFQDGAGFRPARLNIPVEVEFPTAGTRTAVLRADLAGAQAETRFTFSVSAFTVPKPDEEWEITATHKYKDRVGKGKVFVFHAQAGEPLGQIILFADAFPGHDYEYLYSRLSQCGVFSHLNATSAVGLVIYGDPIDYIQINAYVVVAAIEEANRRKTTSAQLTVGGASMGGLITRYALSFMIREGIPHQCGKYLSVDTPHLGAFVPPAVQLSASYFASASATAEKNWNDIASSAACQMLIYQTGDYESTEDQTKSLVTDTFKDFYAELQALPWVGRDGIATYAVANGAASGVGIDVPPGRNVLEWDGNAFVACDVSSIYCNPGRSDEILYTRYIADGFRFSVKGGVAYFGAPGGTRSSIKDLYDGFENTDCAGSGKLNNAAHCFVTTGSALAVQCDPYQDMTKLPSASFKWTEYLWSSSNTEHTELTEEIATWIKSRL